MLHHSGSSIEVTWTWEDGSTEVYEEGHIREWPSGQVEERTRVFQRANDFTVNVTIRNNFNVSVFTHLVRVYNRVSATPGQVGESCALSVTQGVLATTCSV